MSSVFLESNVVLSFFPFAFRLYNYHSTILNRPKMNGRIITQLKGDHNNHILCQYRITGIELPDLTHIQVMKKLRWDYDGFRGLRKSVLNLWSLN